MAELSVAATNALRDGLGSGSPHGDARADISTSKAQSDDLADAVRAEAAHTLVPPIDTDDATDLAWRLSRVLEAVRRVSEASISLQPALPDLTVSHMIELLVRATDSLEGAVTTLMNAPRALDFAGETQRIDREGERAYTEAIGALLAAATDPIVAVRQAAFYRTLRASLRASARAAASVQRIALKGFAV